MNWKIKNHIVELCGNPNLFHELCECIQKHDIDPNIEGGVMLREAIRNHCYENVKTLLECGADPMPLEGADVVWKESILSMAERMMDWHYRFPEADGKEDSIKIHDILNKFIRKQKIEGLNEKSK